EAVSDVDIRALVPQDLAAVAALHALTFGPGRFARSAYRVREGAPAISRHCRGLWRGDEFVGSVTMTEVYVGDRGGHWLLGPLAVRPADANKGLGRRLVAAALHSIAETEPADATVILVGDLAYYARLKFEVVPGGVMRLPGPVDPRRLLVWRGPDGGREIPTGLIRPAL
ncbi:MAG: N-acetyltransferase, partial [Alphaproteobacteria bacterium]|nr:N-acetyltransferase [Alphaproteobacteria bacterium]